MKDKLFTYTPGNSFIHSLSGFTKLVGFLILSSAVIFSFDIRLILAVFVFSCYCLLKVAKIPFSQIKTAFYYILFFLLFNFIMTFLFDPTYGVRLYRSSHVLITFNETYILTLEQLFYQITKLLKYFSVVPLGLLFFLTTNPSELAASLNRTGVPYKGCMSVSLTFRYFPDVQRDYRTIALSQQARGIELSKKEKLLKRIKNSLLIISPLIFSTLDRVDSISNAMELRGFGKHKKRSWYAYSPLKRNDFIALLICLGFLGISLWLTIAVNHSQFFNPFI